MTGSAKQSIAPAVIASEAKQSIAPRKGRMDCFVASAPRNDGEIASRSRDALRPSFAGNFRDLSKTEGAGNAGCALHPRSRAQWSSWLRARAYRAAEAIRHSLRSGFTVE